MIRLLVASLLAVLLWSGLGTPMAQGQSDDAAGHPLVGSWLVSVEVEGASPLLLPNLTSFTADGVVVVAAPALLPELPGATAKNLFSSGHGAWTATGANTADVRFAFLVVDEAGMPASINVIDGHLQVGDDGETYTGEYTLTIIPAAGETQPPATGAWKASRIAVGGEMMIPPLAAEATPAA